MVDEVIAHPTYMEHVRHFFEEIDLEHMNAQGVDLSTYARLSERANDVYLHTLQPDGDMPPEPERRWSAERSASFLNWITDGMPVGVPSPAAVVPTGAARVRKDAASLSAEEIATLSQAFQGIIDRDPDDPQSYFTLAGLHWFPPPNECKHHNDLYLPWHRVFMKRFEDALRSVPGCEDVTMPYWDITAPPPDFLFQAPFASYTSPREIMPPEYPVGYTTIRFDAPTISDQVQANDIPATIADSMMQFQWGLHIRKAWEAHDAGHPSCGQTMAVPDVASFDPIFWFFHANWDRLWWEWQKIMQATTYWTFRSTIFGSPAFLQAPLNTLSPFSEKADQTIDLTATGIDYASPAAAAPALVDVPVARFGSLVASRNVRVAADPRVSVMLKGIDRLAIPGTFRATLKADGEPLARKFFFQATEPRTCEACRNEPVADLSFLVDSGDVAGRALTVDVEVLNRDDPREGVLVPPRVYGHPTINVRLLLEEPVS
jgi:tyrosinase